MIRKAKWWCAHCEAWNDSTSDKCVNGCIQLQMPAGRQDMAECVKCGAFNPRGEECAACSAQRVNEPALRYDGGKSRIDLIDPEFIVNLGRHYAVGANKYAARNWEKGMSYSRCYASAQRHMLAFWSGEDVDEETGSRHVIAAAWNMAAIDHYMSRPDLADKFDDRPSRQK